MLSEDEFLSSPDSLVRSKKPIPSRKRKKKKNSVSTYLMIRYELHASAHCRNAIMGFLVEAI